MKKFLSILLALVLTAGMGFSFLAYAVSTDMNEATTLSSKDGKVSADLPIKGNYKEIEPTYFVTIQMDDLTFKYSTEGDYVWNPFSLVYVNNLIYKWDTVSETGQEGATRLITVTNRSDAPVTVSAVATTENDFNDRFSVNIAPQSCNLDAAYEGMTSDVMNEDNFSLQIKAIGRPDPNATADPKRIGSVTITVTAVNTEPPGNQ